MEKDLKQIMIEAAIQRTWADMNDFPERSTRNLIDLALTCSKGRFQRHFFTAAQTMLQNQRSKYYELVKNTITCVDRDTLTAFGINIGYHSCTKGAKTIRRIEEEEHFNIPWSLSCIFDAESHNAHLYSNVIKQGEELGIHTYLIYVTGNPCRVIPLLKTHSDSAFVLFLHGSQVSSGFLEQITAVHNAMTAVYDDSKAIDACQKLRENRLLYAIYRNYTDQDLGRILSGVWLSSILQSKPTFAILLPDPSCSEAAAREIADYVISVRNSQRFPVIAMDACHDLLTIDKIISDDECFVKFNERGDMYMSDTKQFSPEYNVFQNNLKDILRATMAKRRN